MSDFFLSPDDASPALRIHPRRWCCAHCAEVVLLGEMPDGTMMILDAHEQTYTLAFDPL